MLTHLMFYFIFVYIVIFVSILILEKIFWQGYFVHSFHLFSICIKLYIHSLQFYSSPNQQPPKFVLSKGDSPNFSVFLKKNVNKLVRKDMNMRDFPTPHLTTYKSKGTACSKKGYECIWTWETFQHHT
jgi:hypothetical protein